MFIMYINIFLSKFNMNIYIYLNGY